ncbi:MAG: aspartate--tRNA ligase [Candidatus Terrybacteria bacterium]|nr:aspartate--tRNA ligase [Candidatus Terrybacteria bacterium]
MQRILIKDIADKAGETVKLAGWVDVRRDHGKLIFIDLRDASAKVQVVIVPQNKEAYEVAQKLRSEWVVAIEGEVKKRPANMVNSDVPLGDLEIEVKKIEILNEAKTPVFEIGTDGYEVNEEIRLKYRYLDLRRERLQKNLRARHQIIKFIRDYLSERGFTEVETPLLTKSTPEGARDFVVPSRLHPGKFYALPQSPQQYKQLLMVAGLEKYFQIAKCLRDEDTRGDRQAEFTQLDLEMSFIEQDDILNLMEDMYIKLVESIYPDKKIIQKPWPRLDYEDVIKNYGTDRPDLRKDKNNQDELAFAWIVNFPLFEKEKQENGFYAPSHHMFTSPKGVLELEPQLAKSFQHDMILNGFEIAGGSIRIHNPYIQTKIFDLIGFSKEEKEYFQHMLEAFTYGVPPHGGIASGIDRLIMILQNEPSIREVIAFPKTGDGRDLMMDAPAEINKEQLKELGIKKI